MNTDKLKVTEWYGPDPAALEQRIAALELWKVQNIENKRRLVDLIDALQIRVDAIEELGARHELLAVKERIAALEKIAALEERIHEVKEERSR